MKSLLIPVMTILAIAAQGSALAQSPGQPGPNALGLFQFDANQDGKVTAAEFDKVHRDRFTTIDANNDNSLSREEMDQHREKMREEVKAQRFARMDTNSDGSISKTELEAAQANAEGRGNRGPRMARFNGPRMQHDGKGRAGSDANADKAISYDEFVGRAKERFDRADKNSDGVLTLGEAQNR